MTDKKVRDSWERQSFDAGGNLRPDGTAPLQDGFLDASDIKGLPWTRKRGEEWTTPAFRGYVREWLAPFLKSRGLSRWEIIERANSARMSVLRLPEDQYYLIIAVSKKRANGSLARCETAIPFPKALRDRESVLGLLDLAGQSLDALLSVQ